MGRLLRRRVVRDFRDIVGNLAIFLATIRKSRRVRPRLTQPISGHNRGGESEILGMFRSVANGTLSILTFTPLLSLSILVDAGDGVKYRVKK